MRIRLTIPATLAASSLALALCACSPDFSADDSAPVKPDNSATATDEPAPEPSVSATLPTENAHPGMPNHDKSLFKAAQPCELVNSTELSMIFSATANIQGITKPPVTDELTQERACNFFVGNAKLDDGDRWDYRDLDLIVETSLDGKPLGPGWDDEIYAAQLNNGTSTDVPGWDAALKISVTDEAHWYIATYGGVIFSIREIAGDLNDNGAEKILAQALKNLKKKGVTSAS